MASFYVLLFLVYVDDFYTTENTCFHISARIWVSKSHAYAAELKNINVSTDKLNTEISHQISLQKIKKLYLANFLMRIK